MSRLVASACLFLAAAAAIPAHARDLTLATWNLEWLMRPAVRDELLARCNPKGQPRSDQRSLPCPGDRPPPPRRTQADLDALARVAQRIDAQAVALQEVDGPDAARLVFREGWEAVCFSSRLHPQKTGWVVRRGTPHRCNAELQALDLKGSLRSGTDITLWPGTPDEVRVLNVHLKSGCFGGPLDKPRKGRGRAGEGDEGGGGERGEDDQDRACSLLQRQVPVLERWVDERAREGVAYAVVGDFNRRLEADARHPAGDSPALPRNLFAAISDGEPAGAELTRATEGLGGIACRPGGKRRPPIDNLLLGRPLVQRAQARRTQVWSYTEDDVRASSILSDHCAIGVVLQGALR